MSVYDIPSDDLETSDFRFCEASDSEFHKYPTTWGFRSSGTCWNAVGRMVADFSKERVAFIFKSPHLTLDDKGNTFLRKDVTTHPITQRTSRKTESLVTLL